jgi:AcrR family transcriptional regulator
MARPSMEPHEPKQDRSRFLADAVLEAAERVIRDVGWSKARVAEIARVAGVSIGSMYRYFPGRDVLLRALIDRTLHSDHAVFVAAVEHARGETPEESLEAFADALLQDGRLTAPRLLRQLVDLLEATGRLTTVQRVFDEMVHTFAARMATQHPQLGPLTQVKRRSHILFWGLRGAFVARVRVEDPFDMEAFRADALHLARAMLIRNEAPPTR